MRRLIYITIIIITIILIFLGFIYNRNWEVNLKNWWWNGAKINNTIDKKLWED